MAEALMFGPFVFYLKCLVFLLSRTLTVHSLLKNQPHVRMVVQGPLIYFFSNCLLASDIFRFP